MINQSGPTSFRHCSCLQQLQPWMRDGQTQMVNTTLGKFLSQLDTHLYTSYRVVMFDTAGSARLAAIGVCRFDLVWMSIVPHVVSVKTRGRLARLERLMGKI